MMAILRLFEAWREHVVAFLQTAKTGTSCNPRPFQWRGE